MDVKPQGDSVIVRVLDGGAAVRDVVAPDEKPQKGVVLAVGDGRLDTDGRRIPLDVKAGDEVLFNRYGASAIAIDGEDLLVLHESDVLDGSSMVDRALPGTDISARNTDASRLNELDREIETSIAQLRVLAE
jgi:chaperonin GroES